MESRQGEIKNDKETGCCIPDSEKNRSVMKKMKGLTLKELYAWKGIYEKLIACDDCFSALGNGRVSHKKGYSPEFTLKCYEYEIKLREQEGKS